MTDAQATKLANVLLRRYALKNYAVQIATGKTECAHNPNTIVLASSKLADDAKAANSVLHQIAHAMLGSRAKDEPVHGPTFRKTLSAVRQDYKRCTPYISPA